MDFLHYDLGHLNKQNQVIVGLSNQANVKLMDNCNLNNYRRGGRHNFYGGLALESPFRISPPYAGNWHIVIDLGGYGGQIRANVRVA